MQCCFGMLENSEIPSPGMKMVCGGREGSSSTIAEVQLSDSGIQSSLYQTLMRLARRCYFPSSSFEGWQTTK